MLNIFGIRNYTKARQSLYNARKLIPVASSWKTRRKEQIRYEAIKLRREGKCLKILVARAYIYGTMRKG
jgi:hypothetical protein